MLNKVSIDDINFKGLRTLVRCDFNVPLQDGKITDENRLVASLPTIRKLIGDGAKVILCSHLGKPKGEPKPELSLAPVAVRLSELLGQEVKFAADPEVVGPNAKAAVAAMKDGDVILLENTRYRKEETKNEDNFSKELASLADIFVNDAFGTAHRAHCSNVGVAKYVKTTAVGYLMQKEITFLGNAVNNPKRPFIAILGGSKVSSKISVINNLLDKVDTLIIGGGMAYTFMKAQGGTIGNSLCEDDYLDYANDMIKKAADKGVKMLLPVDTVIADDFSENANTKVVKAGQIPDGWQGLDIGPETCSLFADAVKNAKTVVWNGPMGVFEMKKFAKGTEEVARALADTDAVTIIGGGDSAAAVNQLGYGDKMTHISTGGGASLEFLEGKELPGIAAATDKKRHIMAAGNWKMNMTPRQVVELINTLKPLVADKSDTTDVVLCVPAIDILPAVEAAKGSCIHIGAENMYFEEKGAYTGEISPDMLTDAGAEYVIIGHSERRQYFAETDETVNKKVLKAFEHGLKPIICCGETLTQREQGITIDWIRQQVKIAFLGVTAEQAASATIAYEPIWAIGTGKVATAEQAEEVCGAIRNVIAEIYDASVAANITILYGGSVSASSAPGLFAMEDIDGGLVGGASLKPDFAKIVKFDKQ